MDTLNSLQLRTLKCTKLQCTVCSPAVDHRQQNICNTLCYSSSSWDQSRWATLHSQHALGSPEHLSRAVVYQSCDRWFDSQLLLSKDTCQCVHGQGTEPQVGFCLGQCHWCECVCKWWFTGCPYFYNFEWVLTNGYLFGGALNQFGPHTIHSESVKWCMYYKSEYLAF